MPNPDLICATVGELKKQLSSVPDDTLIAFYPAINARAGDYLLISDLLLSNTLDIFNEENEDLYQDVLVIYSDRHIKLTI